MTVRLIKKYPNRRLYDTQQSKYINTDDLKDMILNFDDFSVVEVKSKQDITAITVIQIIGDLETKTSHPVLTKQILFQLVRLYQSPMSAGFAEYLEKTLDLYVRQQELIREQMHKMADLNSLNFMETMTKNPLNFWDMTNTLKPGKKDEENSD